MKLSWYQHWLAAAGMLAAPALLMAQDAPNADREAVFQRLDKNNDGQLERDEVPEAQQRMFDRLLKGDKNSDGKLTKAEFLGATAEETPRQAPPGGGGRPGGDVPPDEQAAEIFQKADANGDKKLEESEVPEDRRDMFRQMVSKVDADGDKKLTLDEFRKGLGIMRGDAGSPPRPPQDGRPPVAGGEQLFRALDADNDGKISREEMYAAPEALKKLDRNNDGVVDRAEALGPPPGEMAMAGRPGNPPPGALQGGPVAEAMMRRMKEADKNGDGKISKDEAPDRMKENFDRIDRNGDGMIDDDELKAMVAMMSRMAGGQPGQPGGAGNGETLLKQFDKNSDGKLSKDELPERMQENFGRMDRNGDGVIDGEELKAMAGRRPDQDKK